VVGTWINVAGILIGALMGVVWKQNLAPGTQMFIKTLLGALLLFSGLRLGWVGLTSGGTFVSLLKQLALVFVALALGKWVGRLMRLQKTSNRLGQFARRKMESASPSNPNRFSDGFFVCALLFCAAPLGSVGALTDGLDGFWLPLAIKGVMDGLGAVSFAAMFGVGVLFSSVPVLVFQGSITLVAARWLLPWLESRGVADPLHTTAGFLVICISLLVFEMRRIEVTDYLPALVLAPLFAWWLG